MGAMARSPENTWVILPACTVLLSLLLPSTIHAIYLLEAPATPISEWEDATATYYGGSDGAGTMGGACGYGNLNEAGYGMNTAAASIAMWDSGAICGACFEVKCAEGKYCIKDKSVVVTVTNQCPQGSEGGWCDSPHRHLDMAMPAWLHIATDPIAGVIRTQMRRVECPLSGGSKNVKFSFAGHAFWTQIVIMNVGGAGTLSKVEWSKDDGVTWTAAKRNWGNVFSTGGLEGVALNFRLTSADKTIVLENCTDKDWKYGDKPYFECRGNF